MSASAGRVLLIPKGDYDSQTTYNMLDMVYYGGKTYVCKQTSTGNVPTNTVYWQIMLDGAGAFSELSDVEITNVQNGDGVAYNAVSHKWENTSPVSISIISPPAKTDYISGEILDITGIVVVAEYSTGTTRIITNECTFSPANGTTLTPANTSVTVSWRTFTATQAITVAAPIYGVEWDGSSSPTYTRTDSAADFVDPVPYYAGMTGDPSSPFDTIYPWSQMTIINDDTCGKLVSIPKYYYKLSQNGNSLKIQISATSQEGFSVSPAHMDRNDNNGERDVVYVGRYHCDSTTKKSVSNSYPYTNKTRSVMRETIHNLGTDVWQWDFATLFTIWLLYLVEFAGWNSQAKIGYGCGDNSAIQNVGYTDSMPYHTGTTQSSRTTYGLGTQYRHIEGLWDDVMDWLDGCYDNAQGLNIILNPANFSDSSGGTAIGVPTSGFPSQLTLKEVSGTFPMFIPTASSGSNSTYTCDQWNYASDRPCLICGSYYGTVIGLYYGLFYIGDNDIATESTAIGTRIMKLPANS